MYVCVYVSSSLMKNNYASVGIHIQSYVQLILYTVATVCTLGLSH